MPEWEPRSEVWTDIQLKDKVVAAFNAGERGVCRMDELPDVVIAGKVFDRLRTLQEGTTGTMEERGFNILHDPASERLIIPKQEQSGILKGPGTSLDQGFQMTVSPVLSEKALSKAESVFGSDVVADAVERIVARSNSSSAEARELMAGFGRTPDEKIFKGVYALPVGGGHTHPTEHTFSPGDIATFLHSPWLRYGVLGSAGARFSMVLTTKETESIHDAASKMQEWTQEMIEQIRSFERTNSRRISPEQLAQLRTQYIAKLARLHNFGFYQSGPGQRQLQRLGK